MNKQTLYAQIILKNCLQVEKNQPLVIIGDIENYEFTRIVAEEATKLGVTDIAFHLTDEYIKHSMLKTCSFEELKRHPYFVTNIYDEYAKKDAAYLMFSSENPGLMEDIDSELISKLRKCSMDSREYFNERRHKNELAWCIACVPNLDWANQVFPNDKDALEKLWNLIYEIVHVNSEEPIKSIENSIKEKELLCNKLNNLEFSQLHYINSNGTDFYVTLPDKATWCSGVSYLKNGKKVIVNFPTEEVFTAPHKYKVNGTICSTMPLLASGVIIEGIKLTLKDGEIIEIHADKNEETLKKLILDTEGANYLGEVALVPYNSLIRNTETLFYTTLLDENASSHFAFGNAYAECYEGSDEMTEEELDKIGMNVSKTHIDFMVGSKDLEIIGTTKNNKTIKIFEKGNYTKEIME